MPKKLDLQTIHYVALFFGAMAAGLPNLEVAFPPSAAPYLRGAAAVSVLLSSVLGLLSPSVSTAPLSEWPLPPTVTKTTTEPGGHVTVEKTEHAPAAFTGTFTPANTTGAATQNNTVILPAPVPADLSNGTKETIT